MPKKRRRKKEPEHINESWLLPYSDLLTLLLALFIVLFASSSLDEVKMSKMSSVFSEIFEGGSGIMSYPSPTEQADPNDLEEKVNQASSYLKDQKSLGAIQEEMENFIAVHELEGQFETQLTDEGLLITIRDNVLFDMGKANVKPEYLPIAKDLAALLQLEEPREIVVAGHTDSIPINTVEFESNWDLSMKRATNFLRVLMQNSNLNPSHFSAKGYAENRPIASNDTEEGRSKNRRVEVLIKPLVTKEGSKIN